MKLENYYDVVVVGAGPGGSITARDCAKAGLKVLLLEKRPEIGAPKRCGEGVSIDLLKRLGYTGRERFVTQKITNILLFIPREKRIAAQKIVDFCVLERKVFDKFLAYDAAAAGAKVIAKAEAVDIIKDKGKVAGVVVEYNGERQNIAAKVVVAADGVESKVARMAGMNTQLSVQNVISCHQYEMAGIALEDPNALYFYFGATIAPGGYIWIFPKGEHIANVGIGCVLSKNNGRSPKYYLDKWIESVPFFKKGSIIEENAGGVPFGNFLKKMTADNFVLVGDAAHQVNPTTGGGIAEATFAGQLAANVIVRAINEGDISEKNLDEYNKLWWKEHGNRFEKLEKVVNECLNITDEEISSIVDSIGDEGLLRLLKGDRAFAAKIIIKNPKLAMIAAKLI